MAELASADAADRARREGLRVSGPDRSGRAERSRWRRLDDRVHAQRGGRARSPTSCSGSRWSSSAGGSPTGSRPMRCRPRSTATPSSGGPWWTPPPPSPGCKSLHSSRAPVENAPQRCRAPSGPERLRVDGVRLDRREHDQLNEAFWLSHMRVGFGVFVGECLAVVVYLRARRPRRAAACSLASRSGPRASARSSFLALGWIARQSWRVGFSLVWSLGCGWALAACAHLDGGLDSPLLYLVLFPVIYAALGVPPVGCGHVRIVGARSARGDQRN